MKLIVDLLCDIHLEFWSFQLKLKSYFGKQFDQTNKV